MSDDLERQLHAFGQTLEATVGEPMGSSARPVAPGSGRSGRRWAVLGAAACLAAVVAGLLLLLNGDDGQVTTEPPAPTESTSVTSAPMPSVPVDLQLLRFAPIADVMTGCEADDVVISADFAATGTTSDEAFAIAYDAIVDHTPPEVEVLPATGWTEADDASITVRYLDRGRGVEGIVRMRLTGTEWRVTELAQCLPGRTPVPVQTTTSTTVTIPAVTVPGAGAPPLSSLDLNSAEPTSREPIPPADALGVAQWGWALQRRSGVDAYGVFEASNCGEWLEAAALGGVPVRTDLYTRLGDDLDWLSVTYVDYGTAEAAGRRLAAMEDPVASCESWAQPTDDLEAIEATTVSGGQAFGWRVGELREYAISGEDGLSLLVQGGFLSDDDWSDVLSGAASYLASDPARGEVIGSDVEVLPPGENLGGQSAAAGPSRAAPLMEGKRVRSAAFTETVPVNLLGLSPDDWRLEGQSTESVWNLVQLSLCDVKGLEPLFDSYFVLSYFTNESLGVGLQTQVFDLPDGMDGAQLADVYRELDDCPFFYGRMDPVVGLSPTPTLNVPDATGAVFDTQMFDRGGPIDSRFVDISVPGPGSRFVSISFRGEPRENVTVELIDDLVARAQQYLFGDAYRPPG